MNRAALEVGHERPKILTQRVPQRRSVAVDLSRINLDSQLSGAHVPIEVLSQDARKILKPENPAQLIESRERRNGDQRNPLPCGPNWCRSGIVP